MHVSEFDIVWKFSANNSNSKKKVWEFFTNQLSIIAYILNYKSIQFVKKIDWQNQDYTTCSALSAQLSCKVPIFLEQWLQCRCG